MPPTTVSWFARGALPPSSPIQVAIAGIVALAFSSAAVINGGPTTLEQDWINRSTAVGVTQAKRFTTASDVTNWVHPDGGAGQASLDPGDGIIGDGCLKINFPAELGSSSASWRVPLNAAWTTDNQGFGATPFYVVYACKFSPGSLAPSNGGGGPKLSILGEYRPSSPGSSDSNQTNEVVVQNTFFRGILQAYRQDGSNFPGFDDYDTHPGHIMFQNAIDRGAGVPVHTDRYCEYVSGGAASAGCWQIPTGEWFWVKQRVELPSMGGSAGNKFDLWAAKATDSAWTHLIHFENFLIGPGEDTPLGPNGLWLLPYDTGRTGASYDSYRKYDQITVSLNDIAMPAAIPAIPYALPGVGESLVVSGGNTISAIKPSAFTNYQMNYAIFNSYGFGIHNPYYSRYGAMVFGGTGGHLHPDFTGFIAWDETTGNFVLHEHNNGGVRYGGIGNDDHAYIASQTNGAPYWEISDCPEVPSPPHPYQNMALRPPQLGGGPRGSAMYVCHVALGVNGTNHSPSVHAFEFVGNMWERVTDNVLTGSNRYDSAVIFDEKRKRYWIFPQPGNEDQFVRYLDASDANPANWNFVYPSLGTWPAVSEIGNGGCGFMYRDYIFIQLSNGGMACLDPDDIAANFSYVNISGPSLPSHRNLFEYYPPNNKFYWCPTTGGTTLNRLTPPAGNPRTGTWVHDTVSITPGLTAQTNDGDSDSATGHYHALMYMPGSRMLAWFFNVTSPPQLLHPE